MRSPLSLPKLGLAIATACALLPATAGAATLSEQNGALVYQGEGAEGLSLIVSDGTDYDTQVDYLTFGDSGADRIDIQTSLCKPDIYEGQVRCEKSPTRPIQIIGSDGKDSISILGATHVPDSIPITIDGRGGDDQIKDSYDGGAGRTLLGGAGNDTIEGLAGNDKIDGGDGNDTVDGGEGNDEVRGGGGDDVLWGDHYKTPGADLLDGGPGTDQIDEWAIPDADVRPQPSISVNGVADDGRPGEGDNVVSVEKFQVHTVNATFVGSDASESVEILNADEGASSLDGGGGNDVLKAYDLQDTVNGGPGDDTLEGGMGNDTVTGGPGKDTIMGDSSSSHCTWLGSCKVPFGNDTIQAQDGEVDQIDCGIGEDTAYVDAIDVYTSCETVKVAGGGSSGGGGTSGGGTGGGGGSAGGGSSAKLVVVGAAKVKTLLSGRLAVSVPCSGACRVTVVAKKGGTTIATGSATLLKAGAAKVKLKVNAKAKRSLKRAKKLNLTVTATVKGADGKPAKLTRAVKLA